VTSECHHPARAGHRPAALDQGEALRGAARVIDTVIRGLGIGKDQGGHWVRDPDAPTERYVELHTWLGKRGGQ